jgi:mannose-6-phosphate isomerase
MERLIGTVQAYAWGSTSAIPELLGTEPTGEPQAELWLGAHPLAPSRVGDRTLDQVIEADPVTTLGARSVASFGPRLPFLLKVLAAARPLSLQAHPSRAQAEVGFAREQAAGIPSDSPQRMYRDDWPKPEVLCALFESEALCGFRDPDETFALFDRLGVASVTDLVAPLNDSRTPPDERLATVFGRLLQLSADERRIVDSVAAAASRAERTGTFGEFVHTAVQLHEFYPGDPGVLAALLMNRVVLHRYDAVYLAAGNLHAYLRGGGVEIMANSDNVMRGGLTPKHIDVDELLSIVDFQPGFPGFVHPVEDAPGIWRYPTPAPEFALWRVDISGEAAAPGDGARVLLVTEGSLRLTSDGQTLDLARGQAAFLAASESVLVSGTGTAFVGAPGLP